MKQAITKIVIATTISVAIVVTVVIIAGKWAGVQAQRNRIIAAQGCMEASRYRYDNGQGVSSEEPIMESVANCMEAKGY